jgi:tetratricopeptide (TPR) repeat protein
MREEYTQAVELVERAAGVTLDHYGSASVEYARTQEHLASLASAQKQDRQAEALYRQAVDIYLNAEGRDSRVYAEGLFHLAYFFAGTKQFEKADEMLQELTAISENDIGVAELEKADYYELYANVLQELGRGSEAEKLMKRVETIWAENRETED